jgi:hypothetical protein
MRTLLPLVLAAAVPPISVAPVAPAFAPAADEYRRLWQSEGPAIVAAMERVAGLRYPPGRIFIIVSEGRPMTAYDGRTIRLRASYSPAYKEATLVHELGHRLALALPSGGELDDHRLLYLFLYDVWTDLYGQAFADRMVGIERRIGPAYESAWNWALAMTREQRQARLGALRAASRQSAREGFDRLNPNGPGPLPTTYRPAPDRLPFGLSPSKAFPSRF